MAKVSVIIPVLNGAEYIRECMDSIVGQTISDIEIIPVDAGSTDGTLEILKEYAKKDARIKLLTADKKSMGYQYNVGIAAAEGEYVGFCESDDYISETMYEKLARIAEKEDLDYIRSDFDMFIDKDERIFLNYHILAGNRNALYGKIIKPTDYPDILYRDVNMWNGIYKREFIERHAIKLNETSGAAFQDTGFVMQTFLAAKRAMYVHVDANKYRRDNIGSSVYNLKGVVNVVQEAEYSEEYLSSLKVTDGNVCAVIFKRFCSIFFGFYGKLPEKGQFTEDIERAVNKFKKLAEMVYPRLPYYSESFEGIGNSLSLNILFKDLDAFDALRKQIEEIERDCRHRFYQHIVGYPRAVIFGAGEVGASLYAMLRKNDYEGVACFSDNDAAKWGKYLMGKEVIAPDRLDDLNDGKTVFIIAMTSNIETVREQLIAMNVGRENICKAIAIIPHNAMEVDIR